MHTQSNSDVFSIPVDHVSDTAYLVAAYRLTESKRSDRHFDDSLAAKLLGTKGDEVLALLSDWKLGEWMMAVRTTLIDQTILKLINEGLDTVVNLAAGLDTRPYRMALPKDLNWIEADYEGIISFKSEKLESEQPKCRLQRVQLDLANPKERAHFFASFKDLGRFAVLSEGLLIYLDPKDVLALSNDLASHTNLKAWIMDVASLTGFRAMRHLSPTPSSTTEARVQFKFLPEEGVNYFEKLGWKVSAFFNFLEHGKKLNRFLPDDVLKSVNEADFNGMGIAVLKR